jgi:ectoine hydroxylase-related dioxygenase (phytanoyl-CoA dioxygenase family)
MEVELKDPRDGGELGIFHLGRLWSRCLRERYGRLNEDLFSNEWAMDNVIYHGLNLPIEDTIRHLYQDAPTFSEFEKWVMERNGGEITRETIDRINATVQSLLAGTTQQAAAGSIEEFVLSERDRAFWQELGYLVVSGIFDQDDIRAAENAVWEHLAMDRNDPATWYGRSRDHGIMVQFFHHPALDLLRQSAALKAVFAQIWGTSDLWISTDRVSFNPPERPGQEFPGPRLHWDVSLELPIPFGVQGLIYLTDTEPEQGAFTCVPGFHTRIESWLRSLPSGADPRQQDLEALGAVPIPGRAGDVVIWHQALPHGSRPNRCSRPRIVQYVTMFPSDAGHAETWR